MARTSTDLLEPKGHIPLSLFPADTEAQVKERLQAYLREAYARSAVVALEDEGEKDAAAEAWAYHRAYRAAHVEFSTSASRRSIEGQGSSSYDARQIANLAREAASWRTEYDRLADDAEIEPRAARVSSTVRTIFRY